jgi:hypothetical protein
MGVHEPTRRSALVALAGTAAFAGTIGAALVAGEPPMAADTSAEDAAFDAGYEIGCEDGLKAFALAWLERWTEKGGSAYMGKIGKRDAWETLTPHLMVGSPTYHFTPVAEDNKTFYEASRAKGLAGLPEEDRERHIRDRKRFDQDRHEGSVKELYDLLSAVPGGVEAVEIIVKANPSRGVGRARKEPRFTSSQKEA